MSPKWEFFYFDGFPYRVPPKNFPNCSLFSNLNLYFILLSASNKRGRLKGCVDKDKVMSQSIQIYVMTENIKPDLDIVLKA